MTPLHSNKGREVLKGELTPRHWFRVNQGITPIRRSVEEGKAFGGTVRRPCRRLTSGRGSCIIVFCANREGSLGWEEGI